MNATQTRVLPASGWVKHHGSIHREIRMDETFQYIGEVTPHRTDWRVYRCDRQGRRESLNPRFDIANHSPMGLGWGYGGSAPAQLAVAILADAIGSPLARRLYQRFKRDVISNFDMSEGWTLDRNEVRDWVDKQIQAEVELVNPEQAASFA